jgi:DNA-directed RNA polymerase subunit N (RpoN/RPB10)
MTTKSVTLAHNFTCGSAWGQNFISVINGKIEERRRIENRGEYFDKRGMKRHFRKGCKIRTFMTCTLRQVRLEWQKQGL